MKLSCCLSFGLIIYELYVSPTVAFLLGFSVDGSILLHVLSKSKISSL